MLRFVVVFLAFNSFVYSDAYDTRIVLDIKKLKFNQDAFRSWTYSAKVYQVAPQKPFDIDFYNAQAEEVVCLSHFNSFDILAQEHRKPVQNDFHMQIASATSNMDDMWKCNLKDVNGENRDIFFKIRVEDAKPPQMILVNNVILPIEKLSDDYSATYTYKEGDDLDVACINPEVDEGEVYLHYNYKTGVEFDDVSSLTRVGFRTKLQVKHDASEMTCIYTKPKKKRATVFVKFVLNKDTSDIMNLIINNATVQSPCKMTQQGHVKNFNYAIFENTESVKLQCKTDKIGIDLTSYCSGCGEKKKPNNIENQYMISDNPNIFKIEYSAKNGSQNARENIEIGFTKLPHKEVKPALLLSVKKTSEPLLYDIMFYEHNLTQFIYYEYENGDIPKVLCQARKPRKGMRLSLQGTVKEYKEGKPLLFHKKITELKLNNSTLECLLEEDGKLLTEIHSFFRLKTSSSVTTINPGTTTITTTTPKPTSPSTTTTSTSTTTTLSPTTTTLTSTRTTLSPTTTTLTSTTTALTSSTKTSTTSSPKSISTTQISSTTDDPKADLVEPTKDKNEGWIIPTVLIAIVVLIGVSFFIYRKKKPNCLSKGDSESSENLHPNDNTTIPPYPPQWESSEYAVPDCQINKSASLRRDDCYALPVPKSYRQSSKSISIAKERNSNKPQSDGLYASAKDALHDNFVNDMYAEPTGLVKNDTETYAEVHASGNKNKETYANTSNLDSDMYAKVRKNSKEKHANNSELNPRKISTGAGHLTQNQKETYANASNVNSKVYAKVPTSIKNSKETYANASNLGSKDIYAEIQPALKNNVEPNASASQSSSEYAYAEIPSLIKHNKKTYSNTSKVEPTDIYAEPSSNNIEVPYPNASQSPSEYAYAEIPSLIKYDKKTYANTSKVEPTDIYAEPSSNNTEVPYPNASQSPSEYAYAEIPSLIKYDKKTYANTSKVEPTDIYAETSSNNIEIPYPNASQSPSEYAYAEIPSLIKHDKKSYANTSTVEPTDIYAEPLSDNIKVPYAKPSQSPNEYAYAEIPCLIGNYKDTYANTSDIPSKDTYANNFGPKNK